MKGQPRAGTVKNMWEKEMVLKDKISYYEEELAHYQKRTNRKLEIENKLSKKIAELKMELSALKTQD